MTLIELAPDRGLKIYDHENPAYRSSIRRQGKTALSPVLSLQINGILRTLLGWILGTEGAPGPVSDNRARLLPALYHVDQNLHQPLALRDLAEVVSLSPTYFSNLFTETLGVRPSDYLAEKRLERAQFLLLTTPRSIKEIAAAVGFKDADYFCRVFKKRRGSSPGDFRAAGCTKTVSTETGGQYKSSPQS